MKQKIKSIFDDTLKTGVSSVTNLSGGCISDAYAVTTDDGKKYFLKLNGGSATDMFLKEANGLRELRIADAIRIPEVVESTEDYIITEFIEQGKKTGDFFVKFGSGFAKLHRYHSDSHGFFEDNYIGSTPQKNIPQSSEKNNWTEFYLNKRILYQYRLCEKNGYADDDMRKCIRFLESNLDKILEGSQEDPSLLHGDLWGGNYLCDEKGEACLIDPAVYYGHREADLAMTKLFGGFDREFYSSYNETFPLLPGWDYRENVYKLYHVLNHLNLFGRSYYQQAIALMKYYM